MLAKRRSRKLLAPPGWALNLWMNDWNKAIKAGWRPVTVGDLSVDRSPFVMPIGMPVTVQGRQYVVARMQSGGSTVPTPPDHTSTAPPASP